MNTSTELDLIKTILFNAANISDALTRLDDCGISYRSSDTIDFYTIEQHNISFWKARSNKCPIAVLINDVFADYDDRKPFFAQQASPELAPEVPAAASSDESAEHPFCKIDSACSFRNCSTTCPVITEQATESVNNRKSMLYGFRLEFARAVLRTERRLKRSQAAGYQL